MFKRNSSSPLVLFYILVAYVFLQFCWWAYLIFNLNLEIHELRLALNASHQADYESSLTSKILMISGEGTVFLCLVFLGFYQVKKAFLREVALAEQQSNFLLSITHELNSPIASVKLYLQTLLTRKVTEEKRNEILTNALRENDRLHKLVDNLLVTTRLDNSTYTFYFEEYNWSDFTQQIVTENPKAKNREMVLNIEENIQGFMDKNAWTSIVVNLLENAVKYSSEGAITIGLQRKNTDTIQLSITDQGQGISNDEKAMIFKKFYRIGSEETRKSKGTGLGLYIVHFLVKNLHGEIQVSDNSPKGTRFVVTFSLHQLNQLVEKMNVS